MKLHVLKIKDNYYWSIRHDYKTFELRKNDRDYQVGDLIHFINVNDEEFLNEPNNLYQITYVLRNVPEYGLNNAYCVLSIKKVDGLIL